MKLEYRQMLAGGVRIVFLGNWYAPGGTIPLHRIGDVAVFPREVANAFIAGKVARKKPMTRREAVAIKAE